MVSNRSKLVGQELYSKSTENIRGFIVFSKNSTSRVMNAIKTKLLRYSRGGQWVSVIILEKRTIVPDYIYGN